KLKLKIAGLTENFSGELNKTNSNLRLDLYEQKSINTGVNGAMEMNLSKLNNKIEVEVAMLRTLIQETQYSAIKFIIAMITSSATIGFAIYRLTH
ncbi:MAG: Coiled-coil domain-containing protein 90B, mitochondrial, partial [Marteilia pararefringens]